jgi:hypothetical protein
MPEEEVPFKEKIKSIGLGGRRAQVRITPVTADDGPYRGQVVGNTTEHRDGRVDATVTRPFVEHNLNSKGHS